LLIWVRNIKKTLKQKLFKNREAVKIKTSLELFKINLKIKKEKM